jgi:hypothetical protein
LSPTSPIQSFPSCRVMASVSTHGVPLTVVVPTTSPVEMRTA